MHNDALAISAALMIIDAVLCVLRRFETHRERHSTSDTGAHFYPWRGLTST